VRAMHIGLKMEREDRVGWEVYEVHLHECFGYDLARKLGSEDSIFEV
jgi:hypothetical protein